MEPFIKAETIAMKAIGLHSELSGAHDCVETGIFQENYTNSMAADVLAPCVSRVSAASILTMRVRLSTDR